MEKIKAQVDDRIVWSNEPHVALEKVHRCVEDCHSLETSCCISMWEVHRGSGWKMYHRCCLGRQFLPRILQPRCPVLEML